MTALLHNPLSLFLVQAVLIIVCARGLGLVVRWFKQPMVIAEILAGIALGPSLLGWLSPEVAKTLFPVDSLRILQMLSQVGLLLFMFLIGLELDPKMLRGRGTASLVISQAGIFVPFGLGALFSLYLYDRVADPSVPKLPFMLFMGIALSITAFPVLARILSEWRLLRSKVGVLAITCAAVNDVIAWCILAGAISLVHQSGHASTLRTVVLTVVYIGVMLFVVRPFMRRFAANASNREGLTQNMVAATFLLLLASSFVTELIGIHALFGAFLLGVAIPKENGFAATLAEKVEDFAVVFLLPMFFAFSGLRTQIGLLNSASDWTLAGIIVAVATVGKIGGSVLAARPFGYSWREAGALGALMNARGLMELVVLNIGLDLGIIPPKLFAMLVLMALVTTFMTTPLLHLIYPPEELAKQLDESEVALPQPAGASFCAVVAVSYTAAAPGMLTLVEGLVGRSKGQSRIYALKLLRPTDRTSSFVGGLAPEESPTAVFGPVLEQARQRGLSLKPISFVSAEPAHDICNVAEVKGAELILLGWHRPLLNRAALGGTVNEVLEAARSDVGVLVDHGLQKIQRVLVPYHGTDDDRAALALARRLHEQAGAEVTVLHVVPPGRTDGETPVGVRAHVNEVFRSEPPTGAEAGATAAQVIVKVVEDAHPAEAALRESVAPEAGGERYDLVLIGVGSDWGLKQRQFGINQEYLIRKCPTSLLVVRKYDPAVQGSRAQASAASAQSPLTPAPVAPPSQSS